MISKKQVITFILILFIQYGYSQNRFEQGYYISNNGSKTDCLIEKKEWAIWSNDFFYATINGTVKQIKIEDVKEFGIENKLKFITREVEIERSSDNINKLDKSSDFVFNKERILLKVIVEGDLSLYQYLDFNVKKLFFKTITGNLTQLKYKRYSNETNKTINAIIEYKNQLRENMKCSNIDFKELNFGPKNLVASLQSFIQSILLDYGINSNLVDGAPGVYVEGNKIASIGLRVSRGKTYHGISLNVDMDLEPFTFINPCGYEGLKVVQIKDFNKNITIKDVEKLAIKKLENIF